MEIIEFLYLHTDKLKYFPARKKFRTQLNIDLNIIRMANYRTKAFFNNVNKPLLCKIYSSIVNGVILFIKKIISAMI